MKKKSGLGITVLLYCIPYAFLAMLADALADTMLLYVLMIAAMGLLCFGCIKAKSISALLTGNILSCVSSCICAYNIFGEKWTWYFKPFRALPLAGAISAIALIAQIAVWLCALKSINGGAGKQIAREKENREF